MTRFLTACVVPALLLSLPAVSAAADPTQAMNQTVTNFRFDGTFIDALARYDKLSGVRFLVDWAELANVGVARTDRVSVEASRSTIAGLMDKTLSALKPSGGQPVWYADKRTVNVTTRSALLQLYRQAMAETGAAPRTTSGGFDFEEIPLADVIGLFRELTGVSFHVNWKALALVGVDKQTPVTLKVRDVSYARALDLMVSQLVTTPSRLGSVYWILDDGVVHISTGEALNQELQTKVLDVSSLLFVVPDFKGPRLELDPNKRNQNDTDTTPGASQWTFDEDDKDKEPSIAEKRQQVRDDLVEIIKNAIGPDMWTDGGGKGSIRLHRNQLIITQTPLGFKLLEDATKLH